MENIEENQETYLGIPITKQTDEQFDKSQEEEIQQAKENGEYDEIKDKVEKEVEKEIENPDETQENLGINATEEDIINGLNNEDIDLTDEDVEIILEDTMGDLTYREGIMIAPLATEEFEHRDGKRKQIIREESEIKENSVVFKLQFEYDNTETKRDIEIDVEIPKHKLTRIKNGWKISNENLDHEVAVAIMDRVNEDPTISLKEGHSLKYIGGMKNIKERYNKPITREEIDEMKRKQYSKLIRIIEGKSQFIDAYLKIGEIIRTKRIEKAEKHNQMLELEQTLEKTQVKPKVTVEKEGTNLHFKKV